MRIFEKNICMSQAGTFIQGGGGGGIPIETITGNSGGAVSPDAMNNINTVGTGSITIVGNPGTNTLTTELTGLTQHSLQVAGTSGTLTQLGVATNGQLPIGSTGADPVLATLTAGTGITVTNGAGSITLATASAVATSFPTDSGTATPSSGVLNIDGDTHNITTTGSGNTVNVKLTGITQHSLQVGGASNALTQLGVATDGQIPIGSAGADPVLATITAGTGISVTNGAGSISIASNGTQTFNYTNVNTTPYVVLSTDQYLSVDCSGGAITLQFPNAATSGRTYTIKDRTGSAATHNITITTVGGAVNIDGATTFVMNTAYESTNLMGNSSSYEVY